MSGYFENKKENAGTFSNIIKTREKELVSTEIKDTTESIITIDSDKKSIFDDSGKYGKVDILELKNISQIYTNKDGNKNVVFNNFDFKIKDVSDAGQFIVIVGASGCGKSTILRYFAGLQQPTCGDIFINGKRQTSKDRIGMVFQQYSSFPWLTVLQNVCISLKLKDISKKEREERAIEMIKLVGLEGHENKYAQYPILSGGQLQRVAVARNLVSGDKIMLLDEPHSGLDTRTKIEMGNLLCSVWIELEKKVDVTFVMVTHDLQEAVYLADRIYVMDSNPGRVVENIKIDLPLERNSLIKREKKFSEYVYYVEDLIMKLKNK